MLKPAQLYREELQKKYVECWYKPENQYYSGWTGMQIPDLPDNCYDTHDFVSVDKDNNVIGYISYCINHVSLSVDRLGIISFKKGDLTFGRDIYESICNIFEAYGMNRIEFFAFADNPAVKAYRNFIRKHGGRECAYKRQCARLQDGKLHDAVIFEILAEEFKR